MNQGSCGTGMGDTTGTLGLESFGASGGDTLHFVNADTANQNGVAVYSNTKGSFVPTRDGFTGVFHFQTNTSNGWFADYWRHDAVFIQSGRLIEGDIVVAGTPFGTVSIAGTFGESGLPRHHQLMVLGWNEAFVRCSHDLASPGTVFGMGGDANGRVLVVTDGGSHNIDAQWFDENCAAMTGVFRLITGFQAGANTWFATAPLVDGGVAVRRVDQQNDSEGRAFRTAQWLLAVGAGSATPQTAPKWLTDRPNTNMALARSSRAYAMLPMGAPGADCAQKIDVMAPDGTACGSFDATIASGSCRTEDLGLTLEGTPVQLLPKNLSSANTCSYRWWAHALR